VQHMHPILLLILNSPFPAYFTKYQFSGVMLSVGLCGK
jgi:hypothetical protein